MGILFGLLSAAGIGGAELFGRRVAVATDAVRVGLMMQVVAAVVMIVLALVLPGQPIGRDLALGAVSGICVGVALLFYLQGLISSGSTIVAPVSASLLASMPFAYTIIRGARPSTLALFAPVIALVGIVLATAGSKGGAVRPGLFWGVLSGVGYGVGLSLMVDVSTDSGVWSGASQRGAALVLMVVVVLARREMPSIPRGLGPSMVLSGTMAGLSSLFYLLGLGFNDVHTVVATSAYPAMSVVVGNLFFGDRVTGRQVLGIALVIVGVAGVAVF